MDERVKHRIIGFIVIFALIAILAPILIKTTKPVWKSIQTSTTFNIPHAKLRHPNMVENEEPEEWKRPLKLAHVSLNKKHKAELILDDRPYTEEQPSKLEQPKEIASVIEPKKKVEKITLVSTLESIPVFTESMKPVVTPKVTLKKPTPIKTVHRKKLKVSISTPVIHSNLKTRGETKKPNYRLVLGTFKRQKNVTQLIQNLKKLGYSAHSKNITTQKGTKYTQVVLTSTYLAQESKNLIKLFNDKLHISGVVRRA